MEDQAVPAGEPLCVASTEPSSRGTSQSSRASLVDSSGSDTERPGLLYHHFKSADWSADGTTLLTDSADHHIRTFILPPDLLEERDSPYLLSPYSTLPSAEPTYATDMYPFYRLEDPSTTLFLSSVRDHPIRLSSTLAPQILGTYSLIHPTTEAFITPHSIIYPSGLGGTHFLTGSDSLICLFDVSRTGNHGPVSRMPTIPSKRKQIVGGGIGMKGIVSALAVTPTGGSILAAGTFTRCIGLYDSNGSGDLLGTFNVARTDAEQQIRGRGVTQLCWSHCGRYLYIAERKSDGVLIYDIRVTGQLLGWLRGRKADTNQRLKIDIVPAGRDGSPEVWAGGTDGFVRMWKDPSRSAGAQDPYQEWKVHDDVVTSAVFHPVGSVAATCSGQRRIVDDGNPDDAPKMVDNSLKIWTFI